jgi:surface protein
VTHMQSMFQNCSNLTLDCSHWNVDKVLVYDRFNRRQSSKFRYFRP